MPYISKDERAELDEAIDSLALKIKALPGKYGEAKTGREDVALLDYAGRLNYVCTRLALILIAPWRKYWAIALISGVFRNMGDEFYRRYAVPYEDTKIADNGDVLGYDK